MPLLLRKDSKISFVKFDNSWDFSNVLVSGNITNDLQRVYAEEIINSDQRTFTISEQSFDLYCSIYAMSVLSDKKVLPELYPIKDLTSVDLPLISFSINNDFILPGEYE